MKLISLWTLLVLLSGVACTGAGTLRIETTPGPESTRAALREQHDVPVTDAAIPGLPAAGNPRPDTEATQPQNVFSASSLALALYEHPAQGAEEVLQTLAHDCAVWLSKEGNSVANLYDALRSLPRLASADLIVDTSDLNGDGRQDVVIEPRFLGLSVLVCLAQEGRRHACHPMPSAKALGEGTLTMGSAVLASDLTGNGVLETVITYTVQGGSGWTELLYAFQWIGDANPKVVFQATLINWAGRSIWELQTDPTAAARVTP
jgi:hypothetical protein